MNEFWINFWSNFFANIAIVFVLSVLGYLAKGNIAKNLKKFIDREVVDAFTVIEKERKK